MRSVCVAATQMACSWDTDSNISKADALARTAAKQGANIVLLQELFETPYFCAEQDYQHFNLATTVNDNRAINHFKALARELDIVIPISFFEREGNTRFNSLVVIDADGSTSDTYRKTHIPQNPGYEEKFYFSPGDTGFKVFQTRHGKIGCGICWDQWFPESARSMALLGAELIFYPTAIGSEPADTEYDSMQHWQNVMKGHAGANLVPVVASNRVGAENEGQTPITFYGSSFIADQFGELVAEADRTTEGVIVATFDLEEIAKVRDQWGVFRDRRPEHYQVLKSLGKS